MFYSAVGRFSCHPEGDTWGQEQGPSLMMVIRYIVTPTYLGIYPSFGLARTAHIHMHSSIQVSKQGDVHRLHLPFCRSSAPNGAISLPVCLRRILSRSVVSPPQLLQDPGVEVSFEN